jgi:hypothetical protein
VRTRDVTKGRQEESWDLMVECGGAAALMSVLQTGTAVVQVGLVGLSFS